MGVLGAEIAGVDSEMLEVYLRLRRGRVGVRGPGATGRRAGHRVRSMGKGTIGRLTNSLVAAVMVCA
eukprot:13003778-Alexandrium_andersonii.AAC.1